MNLGALIDRLKEIDPAIPIRCANGDFLGSLHSYRGYYEQLAIEHDAKRQQLIVGALLAHAENANGSTFHGYKGGEFRMNLHTPVWLSNYGAAESLAITRIEDRGDVALLHFADIGDYA